MSICKLIITYLVASATFFATFQAFSVDKLLIENARTFSDLNSTSEIEKDELSAELQKSFLFNTKDSEKSTDENSNSALKTIQDLDYIESFAPKRIKKRCLYHNPKQRLKCFRSLIRKERSNSYFESQMPHPYKFVIRDPRKTVRNLFTTKILSNVNDYRGSIEKNSDVQIQNPGVNDDEVVVLVGKNLVKGKGKKKYICHCHEGDCNGNSCTYSEKDNTYNIEQIYDPLYYIQNVQRQNEMASSVGSSLRTNPNLQAANVPNVDPNLRPYFLNNPLATNLNIDQAGHSFSNQYAVIPGSEEYTQGIVSSAQRKEIGKLSMSECLRLYDQNLCTLSIPIDQDHYIEEDAGEVYDYEQFEEKDSSRQIYDDIREHSWYEPFEPLEIGDKRLGTIHKVNSNEYYPIKSQMHNSKDASQYMSKESIEKATALSNNFGYKIKNPVLGSDSIAEEKSKSTVDVKENVNVEPFEPLEIDDKRLGTIHKINSNEYYPIKSQIHNTKDASQFMSKESIEKATAVSNNFGYKIKNPVLGSDLIAEEKAKSTVDVKENVNVEPFEPLEIDDKRLGTIHKVNSNEYYPIKSQIHNSKDASQYTSKESIEKATAVSNNFGYKIKNPVLGSDLIAEEKSKSTVDVKGNVNIEGDKILANIGVNNFGPINPATDENQKEDLEKEDIFRSAYVDLTKSGPIRSSLDENVNIRQDESQVNMSEKESDKSMESSRLNTKSSETQSIDNYKASLENYRSEETLGQPLLGLSSGINIELKEQTKPSSEEMFSGIPPVLGKVSSIETKHSLEMTKDKTCFTENHQYTFDNEGKSSEESFISGEKQNISEEEMEIEDDKRIVAAPKLNYSTRNNAHSSEAFMERPEIGEMKDSFSGSKEMYSFQEPTDSKEKVVAMKPVAEIIQKHDTAAANIVESSLKSRPMIIQSSIPSSNEKSQEETVDRMPIEYYSPTDRILKYKKTHQNQHNLSNKQSEVTVGNIHSDIFQSTSDLNMPITQPKEYQKYEADEDLIAMEEGSGLTGEGDDNASLLKDAKYFEDYEGSGTDDDYFKSAEIVREQIENFENEKHNTQIHYVSGTTVAENENIDDQYAGVVFTEKPVSKDTKNYNEEIFGSVGFNEHHLVGSLRNKVNGNFDSAGGNRNFDVTTEEKNNDQSQLMGLLKNNINNNLKSPITNRTPKVMKEKTNNDDSQLVRSIYSMDSIPGSEESNESHGELTEGNKNKYNQLVGTSRHNIQSNLETIKTGITLNSMTEGNNDYSNILGSIKSTENKDHSDDSKPSKVFTYPRNNNFTTSFHGKENSKNDEQIIGTARIGEIGTHEINAFYQDDKIKNENRKMEDLLDSEIYYIPESYEKTEEVAYLGAVNTNYRNEPPYLGKLLPQNKDSNSDMLYIGDGVRLPLKLTKLKDGSIGLTFSDRICDYSVQSMRPCYVARNQVELTKRNNADKYNSSKDDDNFEKVKEENTSDKDSEEQNLKLSIEQSKGSENDQKRKEEQYRNYVETLLDVNHIPEKHRVDFVFKAIDSVISDENDDLNTKESQEVKEDGVSQKRDFLLKSDKSAKSKEILGNNNVNQFRGYDPSTRVEVLKAMLGWVKELVSPLNKQR